MSVSLSRWAALPLAVTMLAGLGAHTAQAAPNIPPGPNQLAAPTTTPPPGPGDIADAPAPASGHWLGKVQALTDDNKMTVGFHASMGTATMQFSTKAPKLIDGRWSMGAAQPVVLKGKNLNAGDIVTPGAQGKYEFTKAVEGLAPGTQYYVLVTLPVGSGYQPVQQVGAFATELLVNQGTTTGDVWAEHVFFSSRSSVQFSIGRTHDQAKAATPTTVQGTKVSGPGQPAKYRFTRLLENLSPATKYQTLLRVPQSGNRLADSQAGNFVTKQRHVMATVESIKVIDDADKGLRGAGDLKFYLRAQKKNDPQARLQWSKGSDDVKISSGSTTNKLGRNLFQGLAPTSHELHLFVQGVEDDTLPTTRKACHLNDFFGGTNGARQDSKSMCHDASYAWGFALLPTTKYSGKHEQVITARVGRSPALRFEAKIRVVTTAH